MMKDKSLANSSCIHKLKEYAQDLFDLTQPDALNEERFSRFSYLQDDVLYVTATERITSEVVEALENLSQECQLVSKMVSMQQGAHVNVIHGYESENRPALHTAMRSWVLENRSSTDFEKEVMQEHVKLQRFLEEVSDQFDLMIQIGIGGSELGPQALYLALSGYRLHGKSVRFLSNVDPDAVAEILQGIDYSRTLVVTVSKSGSTLETSVNESILAREFAQHGCKFQDHFIAVTAKGSPMDTSGRYRDVFYLWDSVGGRFSVTSMVGGVAIAFACGYDIFQRVLVGAAHMDQVACRKDMEDNLPLLSAMIGIWNRNILGYPSVAIIPYAQVLFRFTAHLQQCCMESNGKSCSTYGQLVECKTSPVIWGEIGTNSQHSFFQCLHQGTDIIPVEFIGFLQGQYGYDCDIEGTTSSQKLLANMLAQSIALAQGRANNNPNKFFAGNRPSSIWIAKQLTPEILGKLLAFYEHKIVFQGMCWGINSFDQEGVSLGKSIANYILDVMKHEKQEDDSPMNHLLRQVQRLI